MAAPSNAVAVDDKIKGFNHFKLDDWLLNQLNAMGLKKPTPVQIHCIPAILQGRDCIGCSQTGTGKTLAFALPILQELSVDPYGIFALILTPTRELAFQISDQFTIIGKPIGVKDCVVVGGMNIVIQGKQLAKRPHIVVATPGRLVDLMTSFSDLFNFSKIRFLVLDEADRLLGGDFNDQIKEIFKVVPSKRQTLLFSATITDALATCRSVACNKPFFFEAELDVTTVEGLDQRYVLSPADFKDGYLVNAVYKFVEKNVNSSVVIFTATCKSCQVLSMMFRELGFDCAALHSMTTQRQRLSAMARFKSSTVRILIATDVASRGLDIPSVDLIINHSVPPVPKDYVHRVGRTARAGRGGMAITFVTQHDIRLLHAIEELINTKLTEHKVNEKEVLKILTQVAVAKRESEIKLDDTNFDDKKEDYKKKKLILKGLDPEEEEMKKAELMKQKQRKRLKKV